MHRSRSEDSRPSSLAARFWCCQTLRRAPRIGGGLGARGGGAVVVVVLGGGGEGGGGTVGMGVVVVGFLIAC